MVDNYKNDTSILLTYIECVKNRMLFTDRNANTMLSGACTNNTCGGNGECIATSPSTVECICDPGMTGKYCEYRTC